MGQGRLTTHVLDTANGRPADRLRIQLFRRSDDVLQVLADIRTNHDGRTDAPLAEGDVFEAGHYELVFHAGDYLRACGLKPEGPLFLDRIPVHFGISNADQHFHVPLLLSPFGYATYRGS